MEAQILVSELYFPEVWLRIFKGAGGVRIQTFTVLGILTWGMKAGQCSLWLYDRLPPHVP